MHTTLKANYATFNWISVNIPYTAFLFVYFWDKMVTLHFGATPSSNIYYDDAATANGATMYNI